MPRSIDEALMALRSAQLDFATPNYCFRAFVKADAFPLFQATQHEEFNRFLLWSKPSSLDATVVQVKKLLREEMSNQSVTFSIVSKHSGEWAGFLRWIPYKDGLALSFWLHPDFRGGEASHELSDCVFDIVFKNTQITNLYAFIQPENHPAIVLVKRKNMSQIESRDIIHQDGASRYFHVYLATRDMWINPIEMTTF
jgi:RimJ/RimL family protein N-acetyltransferase